MPAGSHESPIERDAPWPRARELAYELCRAAESVEVALDDALGLALAEPVIALSDLPAFDTASMDGWAVTEGAGPWQIASTTVLAGEVPAPLTPGSAVGIATGAALPDGAHAVVRSEHAILEGDSLHLLPQILPPKEGMDIRRQAEEAQRGTELLAAGVSLTPPKLGLVAAGGHDSLVVRPAPTVDVFIMGDELLSQGPSGGGRLRDSLRPQVVGWLASVGARPGTIALLPDTALATVEAIRASTADLVMTTGGTARGPVDQLHPALEELAATIVVDQVAVRPGHPMVLATIDGLRPLIGLPGNPLAAAVGFVTLAWPMIDRLRGLPFAEPGRAILLTDITAPPHAHRLLPSLLSHDGVRPLMHHGPAMLSGLAAADCLAIAPPGGAQVGDSVGLLHLPWAH